MAKLELFISDFCPYCHVVTDYLDGEGSDYDVEIKSINEPENRDRLMEVGGMAQVPCLFIDGEPLYESSDIVQWLKDNK